MKLLINFEMITLPEPSFIPQSWHLLKYVHWFSFLGIEARHSYVNTLFFLLFYFTLSFFECTFMWLMWHRLEKWFNWTNKSGKKLVLRCAWNNPGLQNNKAHYGKKEKKSIIVEKDNFLQEIVKTKRIKLCFDLWI